MSSVPSNLRYTKEHEWVLEISQNRYRVGITDYAQGALGDIVYIQLPTMGEKSEAGKVCGEVESTKSVSEIYAPLSGLIVAVNSDLDKSPEIINSQPYQSGWIFEVEISDPSQISTMLTAEQYAALTA